MSYRDAPILIKKYANRRLYNTAISQYITLEDVTEMVRKNEDFKVVDAKTGKDLTRSVLAQIIVDEESKGENLLPVSFLRQLIGMYSDNMKPFVPHYLEHTMQAFVDNQEKWTSQLAENMSPMANAVNHMPQLQQANQMMEEAVRQNIAMVDSAMKMFNPFYQGGGSDMVNKDAKPKTKAEELKDLTAQLEKIQQRINALNG